MTSEFDKALKASEWKAWAEYHNYPLAEQLWFERHEAEQIADGRL